MARITLLLAVLLVIGVLVASATPASARASALPRVVAQGEYPNVSGLQPFAAASNYMSLPGYLRWMAFKDQNVWLTYAEAKRIVQSQQRGFA